MRRRPLTGVLILVLCVAMPASTAAAAEKPADERTGHAEGPRDRPLPTPIQPRVPAESVRISRDGVVSVQVNVDGQGANIVGDAANEPSIAVDPTDPTRMAIGWRQFDNVASDFRQAGWAYTVDGGATWTFPGVIEPGVFRSDPVLSSNADGVFFYNSLTADAGPSNFRCHVYRSTDGGATWDAGVYAFGGDKQWQTIDTTGGIGSGAIYATWNSFFSSCSGNFTRSYDGGQTFLPCTTVAGDPQWGVLDVGPDGELYVSGTGMTIARSTTMQDSSQPAAWDFSGTVSLDGSLVVSAGPNPAGLLGQNWIAVDRSDGPTRGNLYMLASVDRSSNADPLDVMFARSTDGGETWSAPVRVNDDPGTTAWQWFGTMSVAPNGRIDAIWLDTRNDTTGGYMSELFYSSSADAGQTWSPNVALTPAFDPSLGWPQQNKMGDYFHMVSDEFGANLAYAATFNGEQDVYFVRIGDPACPDAGRLDLDRAKYACDGIVEATVLDCGLNADGDVAETTVVDADSDSETGFETITLTETHAASARFQGAIALTEADAPGELLVTEGDVVTITYTDADDGEGGTNVAVTATAPVDCTPPIVSAVQASDIGPISATVSFLADEPVLGTVRYGADCASLTGTASGRGYGTQPAITLTGLADATTYAFAVDAEDEAGNVTTDDNGGSCYAFTTTDVPDYFTEQFTVGVDLDGMKLTFVPDGSLDGYSSCIEPIQALPTDPAGGTPVSLTDDQSVEAVLTGGAAVSLYGAAYTSFFVGSNGYVTFGSGDSDYSETLAEHFELPRVAALYDDLNPATGGTVSWQQLGDRAVATWQGVPEVSAGGSNTFQIELFFDGTITISYLGITCADAIAGLSEGLGLSPVFFATDLSSSGSCGPRPPQASSSTVNTAVGTPVLVALGASDDGLPADPGALRYVIASLPSGGYLQDPASGSILAAPHELAAGGNEVLYAPAAGQTAPDAFTFLATDGGTPPDGGESNVATVTVVQGGPQVVHEETLDVDPGWATEGGWAFGVPAGGGSHAGDPTSGATGASVYGYNLAGDYPNNMAPESLTTTPFDLTGAADTSVEFQRWLGVESASYDHAAFQVSTDGSVWTTVWEHAGPSLSDAAWTQVAYDVSAIADGQPAVSFRWVMGGTDGSVTYPGWNVDDLRVLATVAMEGCDAPPGEPSDLAVWSDRMTLDWRPPSILGGTAAPRYDAVRSDTPADFTAATCIEGDDGADAWATDAAVPAAGEAFYYLVRAENDCGAGSWGLGSNGVERIAVDCGP